jgi:RNA polymerase sigma factor (sigma-70 family)
MPWLFKVVRNLVIDRWRRSANHDDVALADADCIAIHPAQTREWFIDKAVHDALKSLSWECNFAIDMCFYKGYTQTEVAGMLGVPRSTIEHYVRSAMQRLRESSQIKELMGGGKTLQKEQR